MKIEIETDDLIEDIDENIEDSNKEIHPLSGKVYWAYIITPEYAHQHDIRKVCYRTDLTFLESNVPKEVRDIILSGTSTEERLEALLELFFPETTDDMPNVKERVKHIEVLRTLLLNMKKELEEK